MKRPTMAWRLAAVGAATALVLSACGDDGGGDTGSEEPSGDETSAAPKKGDGTLTIGTLLPQTGDLAFLGPPEFAGVDLAVKDINDAGGVLGNPVKEVRADSGDGTPDIAGAEVDKLLAAGADTVIGAAASGVSITVIDKITGAGVVHFSPANTAIGFDSDEIDKNGLYFRTAPSDYLQGEILATRIVDDGFENVAILGRQDFYGEGLSERTRDVLEERGASIADFQLYAADASNYTAEVNKIAASDPDALVLVAFDETTKIIPQLIAKGVGPQDIQIYFVDGNLKDFTGQDFDLTGVKATAPTPAEPQPGFPDRLEQAWGKPLKDLTYGPEAYDSVIITALAAIAAGDDSGEAIGSEIINVTREGTPCDTFEKCAKLLEDGEDIDYEGPSGPTDMTDSGSLLKGSYGIYEYKKNVPEQIDTVSGVVPQTQ